MTPGQRGGTPVLSARFDAVFDEASMSVGLDKVTLHTEVRSDCSVHNGGSRGQAGQPKR
jgi:hypothetical protein